jgi:transposase-like protein
MPNVQPLTREFKRDIVRLSESSGKSVPQIAKDKNALYYPR